MLATALPAAKPAPAAAAGHSAACGAPFGPLHRYLYNTSPDPVWADGVIWRESNWEPGARNPYSDAAGLAQFMASTWAWGERRWGIYGNPYNPYDNIAMMNRFLRVGEYYHWDLTGAKLERGMIWTPSAPRAPVAG